MFITFEGLDFSGKTTQAKLLVDRLKNSGRTVLFLREPGGTVISEKIREILLDRENYGMTQVAELLLFSAARHQLVKEVIMPALQSGKDVVCDRFYDSTTAYQGYGRGLNLDAVKTINKIATSGLSPHVTFVVDIDLNEMFARRKAAGAAGDRMEALGHEFFQKVRDGYRKIAEDDQVRFRIIDGMRPIEVIQDEIWKIVESKLG